MVSIAAQELDGSGVNVASVATGFPSGQYPIDVRLDDTRKAVELGADEIDMVISRGALLAGERGRVYDEIAAVKDACGDAHLKVILETGMLTNEEKAIACALSKSARVAFVKTSTGFGPGGATIEDVELMRRVVGPDTGVKASGGVRDYATALAMLRAGASRLGCSSSVAIVTGGRGTGGY